MRPSTLARRHILAALWMPDALDATALEAKRGALAKRSFRMARARLHGEGVIAWSRRGWQGTPTWTLHRDKLTRQEVRNVYAIVTLQAVERGEPPPPLPRNLYYPRSPRWQQAQAMRDLAVSQAEQVRARIDERTTTVSEISRGMLVRRFVAFHFFVDVKSIEDGGVRLWLSDGSTITLGHEGLVDVAQ